MRAFSSFKPAAIALLALALIAAACGGGDDRVAADGDSISVHYVGTLDDGAQFDSSRDRGTPFSVTIGAGGTIAGFDAALRGMKLGEVKSVRIPAAEAYGEWSEDNVIAVPIDQVPGEVVVGDQLTDGSGRPFDVIEITDSEIFLDTNHRLAGEALTFELELVSFDD
jgi:FKBP-type peptidyl-prolyl cis-trans isomerase 2